MCFNRFTLIIISLLQPFINTSIMWTSDLFTVASSPSPMQKHHFCDFPEDESISPSSECSSRSESPSPRDPISPISPRSIFKSYWSSSSKTVDENEELDRKLSSLKMPLVTAEECSLTEGDKKEQVLPKDDFTKAPTKSISKDDAVISYKMPPAPDRSPTQRRRILPDPPTSFVRPEPPCVKPCCRPWSSTSALIKKPSGSCLRPSRYSFSGSPNVASLDEDHHKKEVSFYSQVSVFEFTVPQEQRSDGWSKYFV